MSCVLAPCPIPCLLALYGQIWALGLVDSIGLGVHTGQWGGGGSPSNFQEKITLQSVHGP